MAASMGIVQVLRKMRGRSLCFCWLAVLVLASCSEKGDSFLNPSQATPFVPPTVEVIQPLTSQPTPTKTLVQEEARPTATPSCTNSLTYLADVTIPDGTTVQPGEVLDKRWLVRNSGTCNWDKRYHVKLVLGDDLGAPLEQALYPARGGIEFEQRVLFVAPGDDGVYRSAWQAHTPEGEAFGEPFYIEITVQAPAP